MSGSSAIGPTNTGFVAPVFRTSLGPGEAPPAPSSSVSASRLGLNPAQTSALGATGGASTLSVATGSGAATKPSLLDRAFAFVKEKFEAFCGKADEVGRHLKTGLESAASFVSDKINALVRPDEVASAQPAPTVQHAAVKTKGADPSFVPRTATQETAVMLLTQTGSVADGGFGTFLRGSEGDMPRFKEANSAQTRAIVRGVADQIGPDAMVAFANKHYEPLGGAFRENGQNAITEENRATVEQTSAKSILGGLDLLFGNDAESSKAAATRNFSQDCKDAYAAGLRAINESAMSPEQKQTAVQRLQSNIVLRVISPALATFSDENATPEQKASMKEFAKALQNFINSGSFASGKEPVNPAILATLNGHAEALSANIQAMFAEVAAQGHVDEVDYEISQLIDHASKLPPEEATQVVDAAKTMQETARLGEIDIPGFNSNDTPITELRATDTAARMTGIEAIQGNANGGFEVIPTTRG